MLNILDLFPHDSSVVPEQVPNDLSLSASSILIVNLPLRYALQYGLNTLEREQQSRLCVAQAEATSTLPPVPGVWLFARSQQALRDRLAMDPQMKLHGRYHPWKHFERDSSGFRPDLWANIVCHYCPTLHHLESFFKCIHLNQTLLLQRQQQQLQGNERQGKDREPLLIILDGFFEFDAVSKDASTVAASNPYSSSVGGSNGAVDQHRAYLKLVSQVMSEVKDAIQWLANSLGRPVQLLIIENTDDRKIAESSHTHEKQPSTSAGMDSSDSSSSSSHAPSHPLPNVPHTAIPPSSQNQSHLYLALGFWTQATATVQSYHTTAGSLLDHRSKEGDAPDGVSVVSSPQSGAAFRLLLRTKESQRRLFLATAAQRSVATGAPAEVASKVAMTAATTTATATIPQGGGICAPDHQLHLQQGLPFAPVPGGPIATDNATCFCGVGDNSSGAGGEGSNSLWARHTVSSLEGHALALDWIYCPHGRIRKVLYVQE